jgi:hypothetical protein
MNKITRRKGERLIDFPKCRVVIFFVEAGLRDWTFYQHRDNCVELYFTRSAVLWAFCRIESPIRVPQTQSAFHSHAQRTAFHHRDVRRQSRLFARRDLLLTRSPNSNRLC